MKDLILKELNEARNVIDNFIADEVTITLYFFLMNEIIIFTTFLILSIEPTEVPPNFKTTIFMVK